MGCIEDRHPSDVHLEAIQAAENSLKFCECSLYEIENHFKKFAHENRINYQQLNKIIEKVCLKYPEQREQNWQIKEKKEGNKIENFYRNFLKEENQRETSIDLQSFIISAFLMSKGKAIDKAGYIWDNLDITCQGTITRKEVEFYIDVAKNLVCDYLLEYAIGEKYPNEQNKVLEKPLIDNLKQQWSKIDLKQQFLKQMNLTKDQIDQKTFIANLANTSEIDFTSTQGIRVWLKKQSAVQNQSNQKNENKQKSEKQPNSQQVEKKQKEKEEISRAQKQ